LPKKKKVIEVNWRTAWTNV